MLVGSVGNPAQPEGMRQRSLFSIDVEGAESQRLQRLMGL